MHIRSVDFSQKQLVQKFLSGIPSECQTVWIQIKPKEILVLKLANDNMLKSLITQTIGGVYRPTVSDGRQIQQIF